MRSLLAGGKLLIHPMVMGELSMGMLKDRERTLQRLSELPAAIEAMHDEVIEFVQANRFFGKGIGFIDAHLLLSTRSTPDALLLTDDKRLRAMAEELGISYTQPRVF